MIRRWLLIVAVCLLWSGCEKKPAEETKPAPEEAVAPSPAEGDTQSGTAPDTGEARAEEPSRMNGLAVADPKAHGNPEAAEVGTLPDGIGLPVGAEVPDFSAVNVHTGERMTRDNLVAEGPALVVFYRGGW